MEVSFVLCLPRDEASVPFVRHVCRSSLERLGVAPQAAADIEIAVSEASTNVLRHALSTDEDYEVSVRIDDESCEIRVTDSGGELDVSSVPPDSVPPGAESGRGVLLMDALVDELNFSSQPATGTVVRLRKQLDLLPGSVLNHLGEQAGPGDAAVAPPVT